MKPELIELTELIDLIGLSNETTNNPTIGQFTQQLINPCLANYCVLIVQDGNKCLDIENQCVGLYVNDLLSHFSRIDFSSHKHITFQVDGIATASDCCIF